MATPIMYTTIEAIRASIGLDASDVPNSVFMDMDLNAKLNLDLGSWYSGDYDADWTTGGYDPTVPSSTNMEVLTDTQKKAYLLSMYSMWFGAESVVLARMSIPQSVSDGENTMSRFKTPDFDKLLEVILSHKMSTKSQIVALTTTTSTSSVIMGTTSSTNNLVNPVTGV